MNESIKSKDIKKVEKYRWIVWSLLALVYMFVIFHRLSAGVVRSDLEATFKIGAIEFANIGSMYFYAYFLMQIPSGILADKIGPKKTVFYFSMLAAVGSIIFGMAPNITTAYVARFLVGLGVSVIFICLIKIQANWFYSKNFALMVGFAGLAANIGAIVAQTPLVLAVEKFGWRNTFIYMGVAMIFFAALTLIFVKDSPKDMNLPSVEEIENRPPLSTVNVKVGEALKSILKNKRTWITSLTYIGLYSAYVVFLGTFGISFLTHAYKITKISAANYMIFSIIASCISSLLIGFLSDYFKNRKIPLAISTIVSTICCYLLVYGNLPLSYLAPLQFVFGFAMTGMLLCCTIGIEVNDRRYSGMTTGVVNCIGYIGAAIVPVVMGKILDVFKDNITVGYSKAFLVLFILMVFSSIMSLIITETKGKNIFEN